MKFTARIVGAAPAEPVLSVDGAFAAPGLNLSHWPGNTTPRALRHDLSTGIALNFARLSPAERAQLVGDARLVVNNHYDTDGCCAAFVVLHPERALPLAERLLAIAACGDFYRVADDDAFCCDMVVSNMAAPERSPLGPELDGLADTERYTRAQAEVVRILPALCAGELEPYRALWEPELARLHADREHLGRCERVDDATLDLSLWRARPSSPAAWSPGRHALFGDNEADRALFLASSPTGTRARLVISTLSWFDLESHQRLPRPDLEALAERLNAREGTTPEAEFAWRAQGRTNASPELWFGARALPAFSEHNEVLERSRLAADEVEASVRGALG